MAYTTTNCDATLTITADTACVPTLLLTAGNAVLIEVLSGGINYTQTFAQATPTKASQVLNTGDQLIVDPARNFRGVRQSTDSCVYFLALQGNP